MHPLREVLIRFVGTTGGEREDGHGADLSLTTGAQGAIESADRLVILGTPGGSRIITMVLNSLLSAIDGATAQALVSAPRFHHQYMPDRIEAEPGAFDPQTRSALEGRGHLVVEREDPFGNMQAVVWDRRTDRVTAASDPRGIGQAEVRYD